MNENQTGARMLTFSDGSQLDTATVLYIMMRRNYAEFHLAGGRTKDVRVTMAQLETRLGEDFVKIHRSTLVSVRAIHDVTDTVNLNNGEMLNYVASKKAWLQSEIKKRKKNLLQVLPEAGKTDFREHYRVFDTLPFAFTDIEMVFDEKSSAVDWIFRYGNPALAELEKLPLDTMIGASFGSLFPNMDAKWLRSYERSVLYGETLEILDYSPEIDTYLKIISFPTFPGHCGCILFDVSKIRFANTPSPAERAMLLYLTQMARS